MKILIFSAKPYEKDLFNKINNKHEITYTEISLTLDTINSAKGMDGVSCFVTDRVDKAIINKLVDTNIKFIVLRSAGFDHVDIQYAKSKDITICRTPKYSPEAIAEFAVALILALNRKIILTYQQGLHYNFSLDNLMGFNLKDKTVGIIRTGNIGTAFAKIMLGFGCKVIAYDTVPNEECKSLNIRYVSLNELLSQSSIISFHCLLNENTHHILDFDAINQLQKSTMIINTDRGAVINTSALITGLKSGHVGSAGLDVYEHEEHLFFRDHQGIPPKDDQFLELKSMPNVIITPHQAFFIKEAVINIIKTTCDNISAFERGHPINMI